MKRLVMLAAALLLAATSVSAAAIQGAWTATTDENPGKIHLQLRRKNSNNGQTFTRSSFTGLSDAQIQSSTQAPVAFQLVRDAGTVAFEGTFKGGFGAGQFSFTPNTGYLDTIRSLGVSTDSRKKRDLDEQLLQLAFLDVSRSFITTMKAEGYGGSLDDFFAMRIHRVSPETVRELRALGYDKIDHDDLLSSQIHGVTPEFIRDMQAAGIKNLSLENLVSMRIHRATPEYIAALEKLGYRNLDNQQLVSMKIHRVTPEFVAELQALGYRNIDAEKLVAMRIHRVTPEFIRQLKEAGYSNIPVQKLISMRIHGVEPDFVKKMNKD